MKKLFVFALPALLHTILLYGQQTSAITTAVEQPEIEAHIRFLASDQLAGRDVGSEGIEVAASYLASHFRAWGLKPAPGLQDYRQQVPFHKTTAPSQGELKLGSQTLALTNDFLVRAGSNGKIQGPAIVLEWANAQELKPEQVKGKWVIARAGKDKEASVQAQFYGSLEKQQALQQMGALGLIELYNNPQLPWDQLTQHLTQSKLELGKADTSQAKLLPLLWVHDKQGTLLETLKKKKQNNVSLSLSGKKSGALSSPNVLAVVEGTDPQLKQQYVLLSAHYDHVGIGRAVNGDSIYNGARDNAVGTAALLMAAEYFAKNPPKRSILIAAWTAEEKGLLGSQWFVQNPPLPLQQIVYNLNIDGAGYNDTTKVTVIGLERTEAEADLKAAAQAYGLEAISDPVPEQNLFDRSDNVHFARVGIPAPTYSMGLTAFDAEVSKYYHQPGDEAESINFNYISRYIRSFVLAAQTVANTPKAPFWRKGDKYEAAGQSLFKR